MIAAEEPAAARAREPAPWRLAFTLVWRNPKTMLLPIAAIQLPLTIIAAFAFWYLYAQAFPDAPIDNVSEVIEDSPQGLRLSIAIITWGSGLFTLVSFAAGIVAANSLLLGKPARLSEALDPGFTRMGGLLGLGILLYAMLLSGVLLVVTVVGAVLALYLLIRSGLAFQALILGGTGPLGAIRSSWEVLRGRMMQFIGVLLSLLPITIAIQFWVLFVFALALVPFAAEDASRGERIATNVLGVLFVGLSAIPLSAYWAAGLTVYYHRIRGAANG